MTELKTRVEQFLARLSLELGRSFPFDPELSAAEQAGRLLAVAEELETRTRWHSVEATKLGLDLAQVAGDRSLTIRLLHSLCFLLGEEGHFAEAFRRIQQLMALVNSAQDGGERDRLRALEVRGNLRSHAGDLRGALQDYYLTAQLAARYDQPSVAFIARINMTLLYADLGQGDQALAQSDFARNWLDVLTQAEERPRPLEYYRGAWLETRVAALEASVRQQRALGQGAEQTLGEMAQRLAEWAAQGLAEDSEFTFYHHLSQAQWLLWQGRAGEALTLATQVAEAGQIYGSYVMLRSHLIRAEALLDTGDPAAARVQAQQALDVSRLSEQLHHIQWALELNMRLEAVLGDVGAAYRWAQAGLENLHLMASQYTDYSVIAQVGDDESEALSFPSLASGTLGWRERLRQMQDEAERDALTNLLNRRALEARFGPGQPATGGEREVAVALLDVDHFKQVNDRYSHATGDRVLVTLAQLLMAHLPRSSALFRLGGEEFMYLISG